LGRLLFGSTSDRVVKEASCPVVSVPPPGEARALGHETTSAAVEDAVAK
jgi:hypothetical protein